MIRMGRRTRHAEDLSGRTFGRLTVLGPTGRPSGKAAWLCRCMCGQEVTVRADHLKSGHTTSCGCAKGNGDRPMPSPTYVDGTCAEMLGPKRVRRDSSTGVTGVEWLPKRGRYRAVINLRGRRTYLGSFRSLEEAAAARREAEDRLYRPFLESVEKRKGESDWTCGEAMRAAAGASRN